MSVHPWLPGVHGARNITQNPDVYELENRAADPGGRIEAALARLRPWDDGIVVDLGCGTGYHLPRFAAGARHVVGVEPHDGLRLGAIRRVAGLGLDNVSVMTGSAERSLLAAGVADLVHARFAYFFGPGCERGIAEALRITRPGGVVAVIDNDYSGGTFAEWVCQSRWAPANTDADANRRFWAAQGFVCERIDSEWRFQRREDLEAVLAIEFPAEQVERILAHPAG